MRRDKTLKICANHFVTPWMELKPNCGSDRAWVWSVLADYADEQLKPELLAIRFANAESKYNNQKILFLIIYLFNSIPFICVYIIL